MMFTIYKRRTMKMNNDNIVKVELNCRINSFEKDGKTYEYVDYFVIYGMI